MATERLIIQVDEKGALVASRNIDQIGQKAKGSLGPLQLLKRALAALAVAAIGKEYLKLADTFTTIQNKLKLVTTDSQNLAAVTDELFAISGRTRSSFEATAESYSKFALSAKELGYSQKELLEFTETLNKAVILGGSSSTEAAGGLRQLAQGIASGTLRGDELISVLENLPFVADVIAKQLGVTRGELRKLGAEGKISAKDIITAFQAQRGEIEGKFAKTIPTVSQAFEQLRNTFLKLVGDFDTGRGISASLAAGILKLAEGLQQAKGVLDFIADVGVATFETLKPVVMTVVEQFNEWGVNSESLKKTLEDVGLFLVALLRTATQVLDGVITGFNVLGRVIATAVFGGLQEASRAWETATNFWSELFRNFINSIIEKLNSALTNLGIDPISYILPKKQDAPREAFDWGKAMGEAIKGGTLTPLTNLLDEIIAKVEDSQLKRKVEELKTAMTGGAAGVSTEKTTPATVVNESGDAAKAIEQLRLENSLMFVGNDERERTLELKKLIDQAEGKKETVTDAQQQEYLQLRQKNQELAAQAQLLEQIRGPQLEYERSLKALNELKPHLAVEEYNAALKEIEETYKGLKPPSELDQLLAQPFQNAMGALTDFATNGKLVFSDFVASILQDIARLAAQKFLTDAFGGLGLPGFASGGSFVVGGGGGVDSQTVAFKATPGERVTVSTPSQQYAQQAAASQAQTPTASQGIMIVNVVDPSEIPSVMASAAGQKAIMNTISLNRSTMRQAIS